MPPESSTESTNESGQAPPGPDDLVRQVAERVWAIWQEELRLERERRSATVRR